VRILAAQGTVVTVIALLFAFIPSVSRAYWVFAAMATQVYLIMYVLMFIAAIRLRRSQPDRPPALPAGPSSGGPRPAARSSRDLARTENLWKSTS
jgi:amino acid transporter